MKRKKMNQYELVRRLGAGGGGVVYQANDTTLMRPVVLKVLRRRGGSSDAMREIVLHEARLASAIEHPNICSIYEVGESEGQAFIVMQYVPGQTLDKLIAAGPLNLQLLLSVGIQVADGLAAAHVHGIFHRDLKPANIMLTDGGLVKILDFGLAKRRAAKETGKVRGSGRGSSTQRGGTVAYMAPEQFVTGKSSEQSDLFALGVILYEMATAAHPFLLPQAPELMQAGVLQAQMARAIQFVDPPSPRERRPEIPVELESVIAKLLAKNPAERIASAAEVREALKTLMKALHLEAGVIPGEVSAVLPAPEPEPERPTGFFSMLAERFLGDAAAGAPQNSIAVLPFTNLGTDVDVPFYGLALADAIATRLARLPSLLVRASTSLATAPNLPSDPIEAGKKLSVRYVLRSSFLRAEDGFTLNWQLLDVASSAVRTGGTISVASLDLVAIQNEICDQVYASLQGSGHLQAAASSQPTGPLDSTLSEEYLQARALLSNFVLRSSHRDDLDQAVAKFSAVLARNAEFAPAHSGLGITHLQYVRNGFGGVSHLMAAQRCFERALQRDPELVEAKLFRVYTFLFRGEKESARHGVQRLIETAGNDFDVHIVAGVILRLDGLYQSALKELATALQLNPAGATLVYNHRARIYGYQGQIELAFQEIHKGLTLEAKHTLLRTSLGYLYLRIGHTDQAIATLELVLRDNPHLRLAYPTLATCYLAAGLPERAEALLSEETLAAAEADGEMAYRLATYFALRGETTEALHWLRKAIYLGNENYPWFAKNPAWKELQPSEEFNRILLNLKKTYRQNQQRWERLRAGARV